MFVLQLYEFRAVQHNVAPVFFI